MKKLKALTKEEKKQCAIRSLILAVIFFLSRLVLLDIIAPFGGMLLCGLFSKNKFNRILFLIVMVGTLTSPLGTFSLKYALAWGIFYFLRVRYDYLTEDKEKVLPATMLATSIAVSSVITCSITGFSYYDSLLLPFECLFIFTGTFFIYKCRDYVLNAWYDEKVVFAGIPHLTLGRKKENFIDKVSDSVCKKCKKNTSCWVENYNTTYDVIAKTENIMQEFGASLTDDFPIYFRQECENFDGIKTAVNQAIKKEPEVRDIKIAGGINVDFMPEFEKKVEKVLKKEGVPFSEIIATKDEYDRVSIDVNLRRNLDIPYIEKLFTNIEAKNFMVIRSKKINDMRMFCRLIEKENYDVKIGAATAIINVDEPSGDSYAYTRTKSGHVIISLSDGQGMGKRASRYSLTATHLMNKFLTGGITKEMSVYLTNKVLKIDDGDMFATIDVGILDLFSGYLELVKLGANTTYIYKKKEKTIEKYESHSLPVGVLEKVDIQVDRVRIEKGDIIVMSSDGVEGVQKLWIEEYLTINTQNFKDIQDASEEMLRHRIAHIGGEPLDDMLLVMMEVA